MEKVQRKDCKLLYLWQRGKNNMWKRKGRKSDSLSQSETCLGKVWKRALTATACGAELVVYRCCSGRFTEKEGNVEKNAATRSFGTSEK